MSGKAKQSNSEAEILLEAAKAIEDVSELLNKSYKEKPLKKKEDEDKKEEDSSELEDKPESEESESSEESKEPSEELEKDGDNLVGEMPESTEKSEESKDSGMNFESMSESELLNLASKALEALDSRGISDRSGEDVEAAEHEINELKEDVPAEIATEEVVEKEGPAELVQEPALESPVEEAPMLEESVAPSTEAPIQPEEGLVSSDLDSILAQRDVAELNKFYQKLGEHLAARNEMEKSKPANESSHEKAEPAIAPAMAMMKSMEEQFKKSLKESIESFSAKINPIIDENKKLNKELADMKKSFNQFKKEVDIAPTAKYAGGNAKSEEKLLVKSIVASVPAVEDLYSARESLIGSIVSSQKVLAKSSNAPKIKFSDYIYKAERANSIEDLNLIRKELERYNVKL